MNNFFDARGGAAGGGPVQWFHSLPPVTRLWFGCTITVTALSNFDVLQWTDLDLTRLTDVLGKASNTTNISSVLFGRLEIWRLLTCFLYIGKFGWHSIINLHLMTQISSRYESMGPICTRRIFVPHQNNPQLQQQQRNNQNNNSPYYSKGETSDYIFALLFGVTGILLSQFYLLPYLGDTFHHHYRFFHRHLTFYTLYIWSKHYPQHNVNLFGVVMKAAYLPFAYLVMGYALSNGEVVPMDMIHGMFVGHLYYYLACVVPTVLGRGRVVIWTPGVLIDLCHWLEGRRVGGVNDDVDGGEPIVVDTDGVIGG
jgi:Derlin-2/3